MATLGKIRDDELEPVYWEKVLSVCRDCADPNPVGRRDLSAARSSDAASDGDAPGR